MDRVLARGIGTKLSGQCLHIVKDVQQVELHNRLRLSNPVSQPADVIELAKPALALHFGLFIRLNDKSNNNTT